MSSRIYCHNIHHTYNVGMYVSILLQVRVTGSVLYPVQVDRVGGVVWVTCIAIHCVMCVRIFTVSDSVLRTCLMMSCDMYFSRRTRTIFQYVELHQQYADEWAYIHWMRYCRSMKILSMRCRRITGGLTLLGHHVSRHFSSLSQQHGAPSSWIMSCLISLPWNSHETPMRFSRWMIIFCCLFGVSWTLIALFRAMPEKSYKK